MIELLVVALLFAAGTWAISERRRTRLLSSPLPGMAPNRNWFPGVRFSLGAVVTGLLGKVTGPAAGPFLPDGEGTRPAYDSSGSMAVPLAQPRGAAAPAGAAIDVSFARPMSPVGTADVAASGLLPRSAVAAAVTVRGIWPVGGRLLVGLVLAVFAQSLLLGSPLHAIVVFAVAAAVFVSGLAIGAANGSLVSDRPEPGTEGVPAEVAPADRARISFLVVPLVLALGGAAFVTSGGNRFTSTNVALWIGSLVVFLWFFWDRPKAGAQRWLQRALTPPSWSIRLSSTAVALTAIMLVAFFFRFYELDRIPAEMTSDHAEKLLDVADVLDGQRPIFFIRNTGREALQFYVAALTVVGLGLPVDHLALKIGTAAFGVFAIPWVFLLGRQLFGREVGLLAASLAAMGHWATAIDRVGLRFPFTAAFTLPALYFLMRAFQNNRRNDWLLCGLFMGIGLHTYISIRVVPALLVALVVSKLVLDLIRRRWPRLVDADARPEGPPVEASSLTRSFWLNALLGAAVMILVFLPLGRYAQESPESFWFRALSRSTDVQQRVQGNPAVVFVDNVKNALLMFNYRGDSVAINTIPGSPFLDTVTGGLAVLGFVYILWRMILHRDRRAFYVLTALFFLLLPSTASIAFPNENPSAARAGGAAPVAMIVAALPLALAVRQLGQASANGLIRPSGVGRFLAVGIAVVALALAAKLNHQWYFVDYDKQWRNTAWNTSELGAVVKGFASSIGDLQHAFHVPYPHWADTRAIGIKAGNPRWENALPLSNPVGVERLRALAADPASKLFLIHPEDQSALRLLRETFPTGVMRLHRSDRPGKDFWVFLAPGGQRT